MYISNIDQYFPDSKMSDHFCDQRSINTTKVKARMKYSQHNSYPI